MLVTTLRRVAAYHSLIHSYPSYPAANAAAARVMSLHEALVNDTLSVTSAKAAKAMVPSTSPSSDSWRRRAALLASFTCGAATGYASLYAYIYLSLTGVL